MPDVGASATSSLVRASTSMADLSDLVKLQAVRVWLRMRERQRKEAHALPLHSTGKNPTKRRIVAVLPVSRTRGGSEVVDMVL